MDFLQISQPVAADFEKMNKTIIDELSSEVTLIEQIAQHIISSGGKRLRPLITLLSSRASGYQGSGHICVAAIIEFFHTSTLLHDDVVDESNLRRGKPTANATWGNAASVLVGDFLLSRAFQLAVHTKNIKLLEVLAETTRKISEGEVMQLSNCKNPHITENEYMKTIQYKTAVLFQTAAQLGAIVGDASKTLETALASYGAHLGCAFQLIDDSLDYRGSVKEMGKNIGDDLSEGKPTLPLIYTLKHGSNADKNLIQNAIRTGGLSNIEEITESIQKCGALEYTFQLARIEIEKSIKMLGTLDPSIYKDALIQLAQASLDRCQ